MEVPIGEDNGSDIDHIDLIRQSADCELDEKNKAVWAEGQYRATRHNAQLAVCTPYLGES